MTLLTDVSDLFSGLGMPYVLCAAGQPRVSKRAMFPACSTAETRRAQCSMQLRFLTLYSNLQFCCWSMIFTRSFQVHFVPDRVLVVRRRTPFFIIFFFTFATCPVGLFHQLLGLRLCVASFPQS